MSSLRELASRELERRERRNARDRSAREFLRLHPELLANPEAPVVDSIPCDTTEAAIRSVARYYLKMKKVRELLREEKVALESS